ncbi:MAG: tyrosine-type recombinase/integrase [Pyrinomonadaceae bacterium]|nr:tyrosine-type recombinase/integrase [Pyrinomonadaceae bacterium]
MPRERKGSIVTKDGKLYARVRFKDENGKARDIWKKADSRTDARKIIRQILREIEALTPKQLDAANMTFAELASHYLEYYLQPAVYVGDKKVSGVRSLVTARTVVKPLVAHFGSHRLKSITYGQIRSYKQMRLQTPTRQGGQRSIASINRELGQLRRMFRIAVREQWMPRNPFSEGDALISLNDENQRTRILSFDEEARLLAAIDKYPQRTHIKGMVLIALDCALRRGEIFTLRWSDIDFESRTITLRAFNCKTARSRVVAMTSRVYLWLLRWRENMAGENIQVFNVKVTIKTAWTKICCEAGIDDFHFHDCRATCITRMLRAGLSVPEVSRISGHSTLTAFYRYARVNEETQFRAASALDAYLAQSAATQATSTELIH